MWCWTNFLVKVSSLWRIAWLQLPAELQGVCRQLGYQKHSTCKQSCHSSSNIINRDKNGWTILVIENSCCTLEVPYNATHNLCKKSLLRLGKSMSLKQPGQAVWLLLEAASPGTMATLRRCSSSWNMRYYSGIMAHALSWNTKRVPSLRGHGY